MTTKKTTAVRMSINVPTMCNTNELEEMVLIGTTNGLLTTDCISSCSIVFGASLIHLQEVWFMNVNDSVTVVKLLFRLFKRGVIRWPDNFWPNMKWFTKNTFSICSTVSGRQTSPWFGQHPVWSVQRNTNWKRQEKKMILHLKISFKNIFNSSDNR